MAKRRSHRAILSALLVVLLLCGTPQTSSAYSVLTHEQIVDLLWADQIKPLLLKKFPNSTEDDLKKAHAYAYGGCLIQDMGYYPFGNRFFSDLVHYVRSGDFVVALMDEAQDVNEYAFALGALSHYAADVGGHPTVNKAVAEEFPKLRAKYGDVVTFEDDPKAHVRTEFGFDVVQVAKNRYSPDAYRDFIGFEVSKPVLERAFLKTYGVELKDIFLNLDLSIGTFRRSVSSIIPEMTKVALATKKADMVKEYPGFTKEKFLYRLSRSEYEKKWGTQYQKPGIGARILAFLLRIVPKVGPFKALAFQVPSGTTETQFLKSVNDSVDHYQADLQALRNRDIGLRNMDFDTGKVTKAGEYKLTDKAYAKLLGKISDNKFANTTPELKQNILQFYASAGPLTASKQNKESKKEQEEAQKTSEKLEQLKQYQPPPMTPQDAHPSKCVMP